MKTDEEMDAPDYSPGDTYNLEHFKSGLQALKDSISIATDRLLDKKAPNAEKRIGDYTAAKEKIDQVLSTLNGQDGSFGMQALTSLPAIIPASSIPDDNDDSDTCDADGRPVRRRYVPVNKYEMEKAVQNDDWMRQLALQEQGLKDLLTSEAGLERQALQLASDARSDLFDAVALARLQNATPETQHKLLQNIGERIERSAALSGLSQEQAQERMDAIAREAAAIAQNGTSQAVAEAAEHIIAMHVSHHRHNLEKHAEALTQHFGAALPEQHAKAMQNLGQNLEEMEQKLAVSIQNLKTGSNRFSTQSVLHDDRLEQVFAVIDAHGAKAAKHLAGHKDFLHSAWQENVQAQGELISLLQGESNKHMGHVAHVLGKDKSHVSKHVAHFRNDHQIRPNSVKQEAHRLNVLWEEHAHHARQGHGHSAHG